MGDVKMKTVDYKRCYENAVKDYITPASTNISGSSMARFSCEFAGLPNRYFLWYRPLHTLGTSNTFKTDIFEGRF